MYGKTKKKLILFLFTYFIIIMQIIVNKTECGDYYTFKGQYLEETTFFSNGLLLDTVFKSDASLKFKNDIFGIYPKEWEYKEKSSHRISLLGLGEYEELWKDPLITLKQMAMTLQKHIEKKSEIKQDDGVQSSTRKQVWTCISADEMQKQVKQRCSHKTECTCPWQKIVPHSWWWYPLSPLDEFNKLEKVDVFICLDSVLSELKDELLKFANTTLKL